MCCARLCLGPVSPLCLGRLAARQQSAVNRVRDLVTLMASTPLHRRCESIVGSTGNGFVDLPAQSAGVVAHWVPVSFAVPLRALQCPSIKISIAASIRAAKAEPT